MFVYFAQIEKRGPIKIGYASDVPGRLNGVQTLMPFRLRLLRKVEGGVCLEAYLHNRFSPLWMRGEWFRAKRPLREYIRSQEVVDDAEMVASIDAFYQQRAGEIIEGCAALAAVGSQGSMARSMGVQQSQLSVAIRSPMHVPRSTHMLIAMGRHIGIETPGASKYFVAGPIKSRSKWHTDP